MNADLKNAVEILNKNPEYTCVLCKGDDIVTSKERGIRPLVNFAEGLKSFKGFSAADKVIGKGAAFMYVLMGVGDLHAHVMSRGAVAVLERYCVRYSYDILTEKIINRTRTGVCPMEQAVENINSPYHALEEIKRKLRNI